MCSRDLDRESTATTRDATATVRQLESLREYGDCVRLQQLVWGTGGVPMSLLLAARRVGGLVAGAFDASGTLVGFVFSLCGLRDGVAIHWSHQLAVHPTWRGRGLGRRLKLYQREFVMAAGIESVFWTYDPLLARNAHLNLNLLGTEPVEYIRDLYGDSVSPLHAHLGTDRFVVRWQLDSPRTERAISGFATTDRTHWAQIPAIAVDWGEPFPEDVAVRVAIPVDILRTRQGDVELSKRWRQFTRTAFEWYFGRGYRVVGFYRGRDGSHAFYVFSSPNQSND